MTGRHWLRKDVILPLVYLLLFGAALYWIYRLIAQTGEPVEGDLIRIIIIAVITIYVLLVLITLRHVFSTYDLERYDPGNPASLKRLMRRRHYRIPRISIREDQLMMAIEQSLLNRNYRLETESLEIGRVYRQRSRPRFFYRRYCSRIILLQHEPLNVLIVDQLLRDCIRYIRTQKERPSRRNILILVTRMAESQDAASAAAGIVNFLGKFKGGTLCPVLLATRQFRLFYPADRTLQPRGHRFFQTLEIIRLKLLIRNLKQNSRPSRKRS